MIYEGVEAVGREAIAMKLMVCDTFVIAVISFPAGIEM